MNLFGWIQMWRESTKKLRALGAEINKGIADLAAPIRTGASDTQVAASLQALDKVADTVKMQWPDTVVRGKK